MPANEPTALRLTRACWGDLRAQLIVPAPVLDLAAFEEWGLVYAGGRGRAAATVQQHVRAVQYLQRIGMNWPRFLSSVDEARAEAARFLAPFQRADERELVRNYKNTLNWVTE